VQTILKHLSCMVGTVRLRYLPLLLAGMLAACATQQPGPTMSVIRIDNSPGAESPDKTALRTLIKHQDRLYRVAAALLVRNADLCKGHARNLLGFTAKNKYSYSSELAEAAQATHGLDEKLQVMGVLSGSGAELAGVKSGDRLLAVEGKTMPSGINAERQAAAMLLPLMAGRTGVKLSVERQGSEISITVPLTKACAFGVELGNADHVNAYHDGRRVLVTRGLMGFTQSDTELAYVLAKQIAHNILQHAAKQNLAGTVSDIIDNLARIQPDLSAMGGSAGVKPMPQELDIEADRLALYLLARAGYKIDAVAAFWQRLATQYPPSVPNSYTAIHPSTAARLGMIEKTAQEISAKQAAGKPLLP
jgi:beta-barrel assembly-enhancing protease